jgi:hypothetical protein
MAKYIKEVQNEEEKNWKCTFFGFFNKSIKKFLQNAKAGRRE